MKALVKTARGPGNLEVRDMPEPVCGERDVKIEIAACGICGTDIHIMKDEFPSDPPVIIGHEFSGIVTQTGPKVTRFKPGDRVSAENVCIHCDECYMCESGHYAICVKRGAQGLNINGAFTKYIVCNEVNVYRIPDRASLEEAALCEPMVCAVHAVLDQTKVGAGELVIVAGPGAMGLIAAQAARAEGGRVILTGTTADEERFAVARQLGIETTVDILKEDIEKVTQKMSGGDGADVFIECSGAAAAVDSGIRLLKKRGRFTQVGLFGKNVSVGLDALVVKEIVMRGSMSHTRNAWKKSLALVEEGKIKLAPLVTSVYSLDDWKKAFDDFEERRGIKTLIRP
ncbi:MAG: zinc-binding dehydrogenase [Spirochaetales bacterium]|jgi:L-iditol 2-dehydrogenase|nr:zinc-binding dehydrogenase [Spirochaetales bacterium]